MLKTIDLCAGIGGIRRGFEMTGHFRNVLSAEIDEQASRTYEHLFGDNPRNDLTTAKFKSTVKHTPYDVLLAGFPCQAFSRAGKQAGFLDETRGTIFFHIAEMIEETRPRAVFLENVENIVSHDGGSTMKTIVKVLEDDLRYKIIGVADDDSGDHVFSRESFVRNTRNFGLPQNRPRVYILAFDKIRYGDAVADLPNCIPLKSNEVIYPDVSSILESDPDIRYYMASGYLDTLKRHRERQRKSGNGFGYCVVNDPNRRSKVSNAVLATGGSGKERNLVLQPKEGVAGIQLPSRKSPLNSEGIRMMTPTEWGRLQGFVGYGFVDENGLDTFSFPDGMRDGQKYKQFGNSVSIPVIKTMAEFLYACLEMLESSMADAASWADGVRETFGRPSP